MPRTWPLKNRTFTMRETFFFLPAVGRLRRWRGAAVMPLGTGCRVPLRWPSDGAPPRGPTALASSWVRSWVDVDVLSGA